MKTHVKTEYGSFPLRTACPASAGYKQHETDSKAVLILFAKSAEFVGDTSYHIEVMGCKHCGSLYVHSAE